MAAPLAKLVANAIANANTGQLSKGADAVDGTPASAMRMIDADARRYQFPNLDYSPDQPYQDVLGDSPVQYTDATGIHPYQDSQPVKAAPPLSQPAIKGGAYIDAVPGVENNSSQTVVNVRIKQKDGTHLRLNPATNSIESVPLTFNFPQGIVAGSVSETDAATEITLSVPNQTMLGILSAYNRPVYQCRAWAYFSGTKNTSGTTALDTTDRQIFKSGNIARVSRASTGLYVVWFAQPMLSSNYAVSVTITNAGGLYLARTAAANDSTQCQVVVQNLSASGVVVDADYVHVAVFE